MLTLFAVLILADVVRLASMLPFFAIPVVFFVASAVLAWRWASGEAPTAVRDAQRVTCRRRPAL